MAEKRNCKKKVLLIEPNYANKFPPVGLMKIASYYRNRKELYGDDWEVYFYKGDLKRFVIDRIAEGLVKKLNETDSESRNWYIHKDVYICTSSMMKTEYFPV